MKPKWLKLAADLLELASDKFCNHGCNDYPWPADWTKEEKMELTKAIWAQDFDDCDEPDTCIMDHMAMSFLADELRAEAELPQ